MMFGRDDRVFGALRVVAIGTALAVVACQEDRCPSYDSQQRGFLDDTPPYGLCSEDQVSFSPSDVIFHMADGHATDGGGPGVLDAGRPGTREGGVGRAGVAEAGGNVAHIALIAQSSSKAPRPTATIDVFECRCQNGAEVDNGAQFVKLLSSDATCPRLSDSRLRCLTATDGVAHFDVAPLASSNGMTCVCADSSGRPFGDGGTGSASRLHITIERPPITPAFPQFDVRAVEVPAGTFALWCTGCSSAPTRQIPLSITLRQCSSRLVVDGGSGRGSGFKGVGDASADGAPHNSGACPPALPDTDVQVRVELAVLSNTLNADAWLSDTRDCQDRVKGPLVLTYSPGGGSTETFSLCSNGVDADYELRTYGGSSSVMDTIPVRVSRDPVLIDVETDSAATDGGAPRCPTRAGALGIRYSFCDGTPVDWSQVAASATLTLGSTSFASTTLRVSRSDIGHPGFACLGGGTTGSALTATLTDQPGSSSTTSCSKSIISAPAPPDGGP